MLKIDKGLYRFTYGKPNIKSNKYAIFDLDSTIIKTKSGLVYPKYVNDWRIMNGRKQVLQQYHSDGYRIIIITNQKGVANKMGEPTKKSSIVFGRIIGSMTELGIPVEVFIAAADDCWRKPNTTIIEEHVFKNSVKKICDIENIFYVGDAAGRAYDGAKKDDFSDSDRKFAFNILLLMRFYKNRKTKISFLSETKFFKDVSPTYTLKPFSGFDPKKFLENMVAKKTPPLISQFDTFVDSLILTYPLFIMMVGPPACGKSTLSKHIAKTHSAQIVSQDVLKTKAKCLTFVNQYLERRISVVLDNTNPSNKTRDEFLSIAASHNAYVMIVHFDLPKELPKHLNIMRERISRSPKLPNIVYNVYYNNLEPISSEYHTLTIKNYVPAFKNKKHLTYFLQLS